MVLPRQLGHGAMLMLSHAGDVLPSHASDGATEAT
jgi:hypothetical protein